MERQRHVAELSHRRDCPRLRREAVVFRNPAMEGAVYEQQTHSVSRRTRRHGQRQRQVHRQRNAELLDGGGDHPRSVPPTRRSEHHRVPVLRFQPACHA